MFILQLHEGNQSYWMAVLLIDEYLLAPYLPNLLLLVVKFHWLLLREITLIYLLFRLLLSNRSIQPGIFRTADVSIGRVSEKET